MDGDFSSSGEYPHRSESGAVQVKMPTTPRQGRRIGSTSFRRRLMIDSNPDRHTLSRAVLADGIWGTVLLGCSIMSFMISRLAQCLLGRVAFTFRNSLREAIHGLSRVTRVVD